MARTRGDNNTLSLLDWQPPKIAARFDPAEMSLSTFPGRLCHALRLALAECGKDRKTVAAEMTEFLGETVTKHMVDSWVSEAKDGNTINVIRFHALIQVTGDPRLLSVIADDSDHLVVPAKYQAAVEEAMVSDQIEELTKQKDALRKAWKGTK